MSELPPSCDVAIVGAGAAGLATAIFAGRSISLHGSRSLVLLDSARKPGAKILVSGGTRCNVTNVTVAEHDFWGWTRRRHPPRAAGAPGAGHGRVLP